MFIILQTLQHQPLPAAAQCMLPASSQFLGTEGLLSLSFLTNMMKDMNAAALPLRHWQKWGTQMLGSPCTMLMGTRQLQGVGKEPFPRDTGGTDTPETLLQITGDEYQGK